MPQHSTTPYVLVLYYSRTGATEKMARLIARGIEQIAQMAPDACAGLQHEVLLRHCRPRRIHDQPPDLATAAGFQLGGDQFHIGRHLE